MRRVLRVLTLLAGGLGGACRPAMTSVGPMASVGPATVQAPLSSAAGGSSSRAANTTPFARRVRVAELELYIRCQGAGPSTVVFESGLGLDSTAWSAVQESVSEFSRACAYDRAGRGKSSPPPYPHGQQQMARELHE